MIIFQGQTIAIDTEKKSFVLFVCFYLFRACTKRTHDFQGLMDGLGPKSWSKGEERMLLFLDFFLGLSHKWNPISFKSGIRIQILYIHFKGTKFWHKIISFFPGEEQLQVLIILTASKHIQCGCIKNLIDWQDIIKNITVCLNLSL